jgi:hypothetical protein
MATKRRVDVKIVAPPTDAVTLTGVRSGPKAELVTDKSVQGSVTVFDRAKEYWKGIIAFVGVALLVIDQLEPIFPAEWNHYVTVLVGALTVIATIGKRNELWVDDSPAE